MFRISDSLWFLSAASLALACSSPGSDEPNAGDAGNAEQADGGVEEVDAGKNLSDASPGKLDGGTSFRRIDTSVYLRTLTLNAAPGGIALNGLNLGPLQAVSIDGEALSALNSDVLAGNGETMGDVDRQVLAYAYSCALPSSSRMELEIGGEMWEFTGQLGLAPEWETGACDVECQEWVSACLLARTNQFGVPVELSLRGNHPALAVPAQVAQAFTLREGSFYGNVFTEGADVAGRAYACAGGRGSAMWELTDRFCSTIGDGCPIETVADCNINEFACDVENAACSSFTACSDWDSSGLPTTCYSDYHQCGQAPVGTSYSRVITAFLRTPESACGNGICEEGEAGECTSDCASHWARRFGSGCHEDSGGLARHNETGDLAIAGRFVGDLDFGAGALTTSGDSDRDLFVASLDADGNENWSRSIDSTGSQAMARHVSVDSVGDVVVVGHFSDSVNLGDGVAAVDQFSYFVAKYSAASGSLIWSHVLESDSSIFGSDLGNLPNLQVAIDSADGVVLSADFSGSLDLGLGGGNPSATNSRDALIARYDVDGDLDWHAVLSGAGKEAVNSIAVDSNDRVVVGGSFTNSITIGATTLSAPGTKHDGFVAQFSSAGLPLWAAQVGAGSGTNSVEGLAIGSNDDILITGELQGLATVAGGEPVETTINIASGLYSPDAFTAKLNSAGALQWNRSVGSGRVDRGHLAAWNGSDSFVVALLMTADVGEAVNVEGTMVNSGENGDIVLVRYASDGTVMSVNQQPSPVTEEPKGMVATATGVVLAGEFMGTLRMSGTYVTNAGGSWIDVQPADLFVSTIHDLP